LRFRAVRPLWIRHARHRYFDGREAPVCGGAERNYNKTVWLARFTRRSDAA
jgi:hypothetical protein